MVPFGGRYGYEAAAGLHAHACAHSHCGARTAGLFAATALVRLCRLVAGLTAFVLFLGYVLCLTLIGVPLGFVLFDAAPALLMLRRAG